LAAGIALLLFVATAAIFSPALRNGFVDWDDKMYVVEQPNVLSGLSGPGLLWALTANVANNWHPLTLLSLQADASFFGTEPLGFHRAAVFLHALNAALAFFAIRALTGCPGRSAIVAALFALHPLRVESVAWISERKDVLSGCFFWLTLISYGAYVRAPSRGRYLLVAICLALGLAAKSMLVTTPCILLLLDYWPLNRLQGRPPRRSGNSRGNSLGKLLLEKLPLLGLSAADSILTLIYQESAISTWDALPVASRLENAIRACAAYVRQSVWPTGLSHLYPIPEPSGLAIVAAFALLAGVTAVAVWQRQRRPYLLVGWLWFLGMLVPVCGLIQVGTQQRADRYTYLPQVGLWLACVWGIGDLVQRSRRATIVSIGVLLASLAVGSVLTVGQIAVWKDTASLWKNAYRQNPRNRIATFALILSAFEEGNRAEALELSRALAALEDRTHHEYIARLASTLADYGEYDLAAAAYSQALGFRPDPNFPEADLHLFRGETLAALGRWSDALPDYQETIRLSPNNIPAILNLALALAKAGRQKEADEINAAILQRVPEAAGAAARSAWNLATSADSTRIQQFRAVCLIEQVNRLTGGQRADFLDIQAVAYAANGQFDEALSTAEAALRRAETTQQPALSRTIRERMSLFHQHRPFIIP
jgi:Flp pilus assembly protein TadD